MPRRPRQKSSSASKKRQQAKKQIEIIQNDSENNQIEKQQMKNKKQNRAQKALEKEETVEASSDEGNVVEMSDSDSQEQGPVFVPNHVSTRDRSIAFMNRWGLEYGPYGDHVELVEGNIEDVKDKCLVIDIARDFQTRPTVDFVTRDFTHLIDFQKEQCELGDIMAGLDFDNARFIYYMVTKGCLRDKTHLNILKLCFSNLRKELEHSNVREVALPLIGANNIDFILFPDLAKLINKLFDETDFKFTFYFQERLLDPPRVPGRKRFTFDDVPTDGYEGPAPEVAERLTLFEQEEDDEE